MRTIFTSLVAAAALVGCSSPDSVALDYRTELGTQTRGVELDEDGEHSNVGMSGTTCDIDTSYAGVAEDYDYGMEAETVVDSEFTIDGDSFLVLTGDAVHVTRPDVFSTQNTFEVTGVVAGELLEDGFVVIQPRAQGCGMGVYSGSGDALSYSDLGIDCDENSNMATDPISGTTFVSTDEGVFQVVDGQAIRVGSMPNAQLAWDAAIGGVYAAVAGEHTVVAIEVGGAERWTADVQGAITSIADMGSAGNVAVSTQVAGGTGQFIVLDGLTGQTLTDLSTPGSAEQMTVSGNGLVLALTLPGQVHFFDVNPVD